MPAFTTATALGVSVAGAVGGGAAISGIAATFGAFGFAAIGFLTQAAIGLALNALAPKPKLGGQNRGYQVTQRGSALDHQIVYGRMRVGGVIVFDGTTGNNNKFLHRVLAFTGHEIESFDEIWINDAKVTRLGSSGYEYSGSYFDDSLNSLEFSVVSTSNYSTGFYIGTTADDIAADFGISGSISTLTIEEKNTKVKGDVEEITLPDGTTSDRYKGFIRINKHLGATDQTADSDLVNEIGAWTNQHRLRGISYLYVRLKFNADKFPNGVPEITATVKGKKVYDPRTSTTAWSDNPALCLRDYLSESYGLAEADANLDDTLISTAANVCDQTGTNAGTTRYTCNGAFTTSSSPYDVLSDMLTSMGGLLWYAQGKWRMKPAYWVAPTVTFTEDDLRSSIAVKTRHSRRDNFNTVRGTFRGEETDWQVTDYPEVTNSAFLSADNGQESVADIELSFTDNSIEARRIARIALERNRQQLTVVASFGLKAFQVQVGDVVNLTVDRFGWAQKKFEVSSWTFGLTDDQDLQVQMSLREISESVFDEVDDGVVYERDNTDLLSPFEVPEVGISAVAKTKVLREKLTNFIAITVTSGRPEGIDSVEVQIKESSDATYRSVGTGDLGVFQAVDLDDGNYDIRARAINTFGVKGDWFYLLGVDASGLLDPPADISGLTAEVNGPTIHLEWEPVADLDLSYYRIRHSIEETGGTWANANTAVDKVPRPASAVSIPTKPGTYHVKAVDKSGIASEGYTSIVVPLDNIENFTTTDTQTEDPTFGGTKTGCQVVSSALEITDPSTAPSSATYDFSTYIDTGVVRRVRSRVEANVLRKDNSAGLFDNLPGLFDDLPGLFDDFTGTADFADTNVEAYISTTPDDPAGTPTWSSYQLFRAGEYYGRAFRFRIIIKSTADAITPSITGLKALVEYN